METFRDAATRAQTNCAFLPFGLCSRDGDFGAEAIIQVIGIHNSSAKSPILEPQPVGRFLVAKATFSRL